MPMKQTNSNALALILWLLAGAMWPCVPATTAEDFDAIAGQILHQTGVQKGLCLHIGSREGFLSLSLAGKSDLLVYGLENDPKLIQTARETARENEAYTKVSFGSASLAHLPFDSHVADLVVVDRLSECLAEGLTLKELQRVTSPLGFTCVGDGSEGKRLNKKQLVALAQQAGIETSMAVTQDGPWLCIRKPWPAQMDEWTHNRYDASGNAVSRDELATTATGLRWLSGPFFSRKTEVDALVSARGRIFAKIMYVGGGTEDWQLLARDAFNGVLLWSRSIPDVPVIAVGDRVYTGVEGKILHELVALDAETGDVAKLYKGVDLRRSLIFDDDILVVGGLDHVRGVVPESGKVLWSFDSTYPLLLAGDGNVFIQERGAEEAVCLDLLTGKQKWRLPIPGRLVSYQSGILTTGSKDGLHVLDAETAAQKWHYPYNAPYHHDSVAHISNNFVIDDQIWVWISDHPSRKNPLFWLGLDAETGQEERRLVGHSHPRCSLESATTRHIYYGSADIIELATGRNYPSRFMRQTCRIGAVPANGMIYSAPVRCGCFPMIRGFMGLRSAADGLVAMDDQSIDRLVRGDSNPSAVKIQDDDWPIYRHDSRRSGMTPIALPETLTLLWNTRARNATPRPSVDSWVARDSAPLTPPVIVADKVYVALPTARSVAAFDARDGKPLWTFETGGMVDASPSIVKGLCLIGSRDGCVYALNSEDGTLVWQRRTAPTDRRIVAYNQIVSEWPVEGGVLPFGDLVYTCTGRHPLAEKGLTITAFEPGSGNVVWEKHQTEETLGYTERPGAFQWGEGTQAQQKEYNKEIPFGKMALAQYLVGMGGQVGFGTWGFEAETGETRSHRWATIPGVVLQDSFHELRKTLRRYREPVSSFANIYYERLGMGHMRVSDGTDTVAATITWKGFTLYRKGSTEWKIDIEDMSYVRALLWAGPHVYLATEAENSASGSIREYSAENGETLGEWPLAVSPVFDGMAAARGHLYVATRDGSLLCFGNEGKAE